VIHQVVFFVFKSNTLNVMILTIGNVYGMINHHLHHSRLIGTGALLVEPWVLDRLPLDLFFRLELQSDLLLGGFNRVRSVADVTANLDTVVSTNSSR